MPQLGETVAEGKITKWFKAAGDAVKPGDNLFEIETDKTSMEVPSTTSGTLTDIRFQVGEVAKVGAVVAVIVGGTALRQRSGARESTNRSSRRPRRQHHVPAPAATAAPMHSTPMPRPAPPMDPFREVRTPERNYGPAKLASGTVVTPLARRLAGERGIDLSRLSGSGPHGRIVARDVESAAPHAAPARRQGRAQRRSRRSTRASPTRKFRSIPCAAPLPTRSGRGEADNSALLSHRRSRCRAPDRHARGGQCRRAKEQGWPTGVQALAQRFHHQGLGGGAPAHSGGQCGVGRRSHSALPQLRYRHCGRARRRV